MRFQALLLVGLSLASVSLFASCSSSNSDGPSGPPASVAQAADVIDLSVLPLYEGAKEPGSRRLAELTYTAPASVKSVFEFHRKQLLSQGWTELPNAYVSEVSSNATFKRQGYLLSLSVSDMGDSQTMVALISHGNVKLDSLPVPAGAKSFSSTPASAMYLTEASVADTAAECRKLLLAAGWQPYGSAGESLFFKQNAVYLSAYISAAPAQGGKTMIQYGTKLMSADLPAPPDVQDLQYSDSTTELYFTTKDDAAKIGEFYRTKLTAAGWEATTDKPVELDRKQVLIFRNPAKDYLEVEMQPEHSPMTVRVRHQTAVEFAAMEKRMREAAEKRKN